MSSVEFVKGLYGKMGAGPASGDKAAKREEFLSYCTPDLEWVVNGPADLTKCGAWSSRDGVRGFFKELDANWEFTEPIEIPQIFEVPHLNIVFAITKEIGINKITNKPFCARGAHLWKLTPTSNKKGGEKKVCGFLEWLCVWNGEDEISKLPEMKALLLGMSTLDQMEKENATPATAAATTLIPDPGQGGTHAGTSGAHFGIKGGDLMT
jgi:hypothetical protein